MRNLTTYLMAVLMMAGALAVVPAVDAQSADLVISDDTGDVTLLAGFTGGVPTMEDNVPPQDTGQSVPGTEAINQDIDITEVKVHGETATELAFRLSVVKLERPGTVQPNSISHVVCFTWSGTGAHYRFSFVFTYGLPPGGPEAQPKFQFARFDRLSQPCDPFDYSLKNQVTGYTQEGFPVTIDYEAGTIDWAVSRSQFEKLRATGDPLEAPPAKGDTFDGFAAYGVASGGPSGMFFDGTTPDTFTFSGDTGNEHLRVQVPENIRGSFGLKGFGTALYGVEVGSFQTVPVVIENHMGHEMTPQISVTPIQGEAGNWEVRTLPEIKLPAKVGEVPGTETITLIVNPADVVSHKDRVRLMIKATDESMPDMLGAAVVDIVAVEPPTETAKMVYFHSTGRACDTFQRWMNTLQTDASTDATELAFQPCAPPGGGADLGPLANAGELGITFQADVPFARDYILSTTQTAKATVALKSAYKPIGTDQEVMLPTIADVKVELFAGGEVIGSAISQNNQIGDTKQLQLDVPVLGRILGSGNREVFDDRPLNVRFSVTPQERVFEVCREDLCTTEEEVEAATPGGQVYLVLDQTSLELPIVSSKRAGEQINITKSGALMTMRLSEGEERTFTNPGKTVVYNVTVRNEGVNKDTAKLSATLDKAGWTVEILPKLEYRLDVGEPRQFNVRVKAPENAGEGETVRIDLKAASLVDADASAQLPLFVEATTGEQYEDQALDENLQKVEDTEESPVAPLAFMVLAIVGLLGVLRRRS